MNLRRMSNDCSYGLNFLIAGRYEEAYSIFQDLKDELTSEAIKEETELEELKKSSF